MALEVVGGGSSAVASSSHAACARFRGTDPLITGLTRRNLAEAVGFADNAGGIPQARWMRAMTFEHLVRNEEFAGQIATRTVGALDLNRPKEVVTADVHISVDKTAAALAAAHERALRSGAVTLIYQLAIPFAGFEQTRATDVKPDFAVVAPSANGRTTYLVMGDAKDYERVRSRIDDQRMLKGFLQVAVGAESAEVWSQLPGGMAVHLYGVLAVPRNAFLQPMPVVENLADYRTEVQRRIDERRREAADAGYRPDQTVVDLVRHLEAKFDPAACTTCTLFSYCRNELRGSSRPEDLLIELGVARDMRRHAVRLIDGIAEAGRVPASMRANITATLTGTAQPTGQLRVDQAGLPGTVNIVLAKSDAAALGVHGIGLQRVTADGSGEWQFTTFGDPQSTETRRQVMRRLGRELSLAMRDQRRAANGAKTDAVHIVVPDQATADVLVSIADNLAGIELSRLRWQRDKEMHRPALTYDGETATMPRPIKEEERTAIALLLEDDRSRAFSLRASVIDMRRVLARHIVAGGPTTNTGRLDYLVGWAEAQADRTLEHRSFADAIETSDYTPGARLTNDTSDAIHAALVGRRGKPSDAPVADPAEYERLVTEELRYKADIIDRALDALRGIPSSTLRSAYRAIESAAQDVWRRRLNLHASDLVRFGRTYRTWRNSQVRMVESDRTCAAQLLALSNPQAAYDRAADPGNRVVALATVVQTSPLIIDLDSRRIGDGARIVMIARDGKSCAEESVVSLDVSGAGAFKLDGLSIGPLEATDEDTTRRFRWTPQTMPVLAKGDEIVVADFAWFSEKQVRNRFLPINKPKPDETSAPNDDCTAESYGDDPQGHRWCCRSHEWSEAEFSDELASRRIRGELNPETWPPVRDFDEFEVTATNSPAGDVFASAPVAVPADQSMDDLE